MLCATVLGTHAAAWAQTPAAESVLPIGSPLIIISDETVDARVRPGSEFRAHLRDPLVLGDTLVATAGTPARLVVTGKDTAKDGTLSYRIAITGLDLGLAGRLPVRPTTPTVEHIAAGMAIPAMTLAAVGFEEGKIRVALPLPFKLSNETPNSGYTPAPLRTAAPILNRRRPTAGPTVAPPPGASAAPSPFSSPTPSPFPSPPGGPAPSSALPSPPARGR